MENHFKWSSCTNEYSREAFKQATTSPPPPQLEPIIAFYIFFASHILAAIFSPIQDCDEVFNYWEPTHYLNHGYGLQTWEYSPEYAIRSWLYSGIHAFVIAFARVLPINKAGEFYFLRTVFALVCAASEARLYSTIQRTLNPRIAIFFLMIVVTSAGMFHASVAYLPSTFAMYCTMNGISAFMDWRGGLRTAQGIMWFGIGATLGWPFAGALVIPFILEELVYATMTSEGISALTRMIDGTVRSLIVLVSNASNSNWKLFTDG
jgi:alpha-1,2-mannosyltransferase